MGKRVRAEGTGAKRSQVHRIPGTQLLVMLLAFVLVAASGGIISALLVLPFAVGANAVTGDAIDFLNDMPSELTEMKMAEASHLYSSDGQLLATFFAENRTYMPLDQISENLQNAAVSIEDQRFWEHGGMDVQGTARAFLKKATGGEQSGGSGITQQYVKNILIDKANQEGDPFGVLKAREATMARKAREAKLALTVAGAMSKEDILEGYLNVAQFGASVYGAEAAAQYYFSKPAKDLNIVEAATIAGITKNPTLYDPTRHPDVSQERRDTVLYKMWTLGYISDKEYKDAIALDVEETLHVTPVANGCMAAAGAGFFCDFVVKTMMQSPEFGETPADRANLLYRGGLRVETTMHSDIQKASEIAMKRNVPAVNSAKLASSALVLEPGTGEIFAMVQSTGYDTTPNPEPGNTSVNYATDFIRGGSRGFQPGSNFKPFVLTQWLLEGHTLAEQVSSAGRTWTSGDFISRTCLRASIQPWTPGNAEGGGGGMMSAAQALKQSVNTAFVYIESKLDLCGIRETAWNMGYRPTQDQTGAPFINPTMEDIIVSPNMVLGTQQTAPMFMASGYSTIASGGIQCEPIAIKRVLDSTGKEMPVPSANCKQGIPENVANTMAYAMRGAFERGGTASASKVKDCRPAAGKTGTSNLGAQTWFTGYFPNLLASVWVGDPNGNASHLSINFEGRHISPLYGSSIAAPLWKDIMDQIVDGVPVVDFPEPDPTMAAGVQVLLNPGEACTAKQPGDAGTLGAHPGVDPLSGLTVDDAAAKRAGVMTALSADEAAAPAERAPEVAAEDAAPEPIIG